MYSLVVDVITFRYLVNLAIHEQLNMRLMEVATSYLYGNFDNDIYMRILEGFNMSEACTDSKDIYSIKLQRSLYGFK